MAQAQIAWAAMRRLYEGDRPSPDLLAACSGRSVASVARRAREEGWRGGDEVHGQLNGSLRRFGQRLTAEIDRLGAITGEFGKAEYDAINAMARLLEKITDATRTAEGANEEQLQRPEEVAALLDRIDRRIVALAAELAAGMGGAAAGPR